MREMIESELRQLSGEIVLLCLRLQGGVGELTNEQRDAFQQLKTAAGNFDNAMTGTIIVPTDFDAAEFEPHCAAQALEITDNG